MTFGNNLQYLRRLHGGLTQEKLAERMGVSRQTISRWESNEVYPDMNKLFELCELFSCTLDALLREDMTARSEIYSDVRIERIPAFRMAFYVIISANPEDDANAYIENWATKNGIAEPRMIGWDFPFVSAEQKNRFGLRGYAAACVLPMDFEYSGNSVEIAEQCAADYAVITVRNPFEDAFGRIPHAYHLILEYLNCNGFRENHRDGIIPCFEYIYHQEGVEYMKVHIHVDSVNKADLFTSLG